ncbi:hypothetical protein COCMIDRAFT_95676 [Bipolaris oryzae ATCC 44560]|uniref:Uncharacterized protein n=1 Tax=Bipolaris oryzae ATCC 44560 TaxID=930090 RepID=W6Z6H0_COCMI|nr:uncharacterized protein COCMIDRAFT_95676 [Bipolaris oryzae ATCC 44560]EUC45403.1 hypothetical protein COCMIDRAFT_95676 [Bipolaris oryzae ATCC 44560]
MWHSRHFLPSGSHTGCTCLCTAVRHTSLASPVFTPCEASSRHSIPYSIFATAGIVQDSRSRDLLAVAGLRWLRHN